jgi:hypothetical protein
LPVPINMLGLTVCLWLQKYGFLINLACFWVLGIPLAAYFDLSLGLGARGVWYALAGASLLHAAVSGAQQPGPEGFL